MCFYHLLNVQNHYKYNIIAINLWSKHSVFEKISFLITTTHHKSNNPKTFNIKPKYSHKGWSVYSYTLF